MPSTPITIPFFGYKLYISIDRKFWLIRKWKTAEAAVSDSARLREGLLDKTLAHCRTNHIVTESSRTAITRTSAQIANRLHTVLANL
mgnify:CR=1 FL=1